MRTTTSYTCASHRRATSSSWMRIFANTCTYGMFGYLLLCMSCDRPMVVASGTPAAASLLACMKSVVWQDRIDAPGAPGLCPGDPGTAQGTPRHPRAAQGIPGQPRVPRGELNRA